MLDICKVMDKNIVNTHAGGLVLNLYNDAIFGSRNVVVFKKHFTQTSLACLL